VKRSISPAELRGALATRRELALFDLRPEAEYAKGHPLFAAQLPPERVALEAPLRVPRRDACVVLYDAGEGLVDAARSELAQLGYSAVYELRGGLAGWREAGFELFRDVNSYSKAFGELVEARRHTPSLSADELHALQRARANVAILDARRFDEYRTMNIPGSTSVPGAELVLLARSVAPDPATTIVVNCAGRTRSIIGAQSLINAGVPNPVLALRNGTIGWTLAGKALETGGDRRAPEPAAAALDEARRAARAVSYRAGVRRVGAGELRRFIEDDTRTTYCFDVRSPDVYASGHLPRFVNAPGGQLVQEADHFAPVRGARIVLADDLGPRADMTASWLAQMAWEVYVLDGSFPRELELELDHPHALPPRSAIGRYKRPYEGTDNAEAAMRAYLDWEYGLVAQLERDGTHGFYVI
jgi:rhodanese-related sulfurtransferase